MDQNKNFQYWIVQLGNMYYVGGLGRLPHNEDSFSFEFAKDEEVAFPFVLEELARGIAELCGGNVLVKKTTYETFQKLVAKHENYANSEPNWDEMVEEKTEGLL